MRMQVINYDELLEEFNKQYDYLYNAHGQGMKVAGEDEALEYFDRGLSDTEVKILRTFVMNRGDFITSDREVVAFMFAIDNLL